MADAYGAATHPPGEATDLQRERWDAIVDAIDDNNGCWDKALRRAFESQWGVCAQQVRRYKVDALRDLRQREIADGPQAATAAFLLKVEGFRRQALAADQMGPAVSALRIEQATRGLEQAARSKEPDEVVDPDEVIVVVVELLRAADVRAEVSAGLLEHGIGAVWTDAETGQRLAGGAPE